MPSSVVFRLFFDPRLRSLLLKAGAVMSEPSFDLFRLGTGSVMWIETVATFQMAQVRIAQLSMRDSCDYLIVDFGANQLVRVSHLAQTTPDIGN
jgi:hypothetical protein